MDNSIITGVWEAAKVSRHWRDQEPHRSGDALTDSYFPPNGNSLMGRNSKGVSLDKKVETEKASKISEDEMEW